MNLPWHGIDENQTKSNVTGRIQQTIDIRFIVRDKCCEKNIVDLLQFDPLCGLPSIQSKQMVCSKFPIRFSIERKQLDDKFACVFVKYNGE